MGQVIIFRYSDVLRRLLLFYVRYFKDTWVVWDILRYRELISFRVACERYRINLRPKGLEQWIPIHKEH